MENFSEQQIKTLTSIVQRIVEVNNAVIFQEMDARFIASNTAMDAKFGTNNDMIFQAIADEGRSTRDFVEQKIQASEKRVTENILEGVNEMLDGGILPQIDDLDHRVKAIDKRLTRLETKTV